MAMRKWGMVGLVLMLPAFGAWAQGSGEEAVPAAPATWSAPLEMRPYPDGQDQAERKPEHYLLLGEASGDGYDRPLRFVLSLDIEPGYDPGSADGKAWLASLPPTEGRATLEGRCLSGVCVVGGTVQPDYATVTLTLTLEGDRPSGRYEVRRSSGGAPELSGTLALTRLTGEVPGLGALAEAETTQGRLAAALRWQGFEVSSWTDAAAAPDGDLRESLATWQQDGGTRPPTGLVFADDIAALEAAAANTQAETGWTVLGGPEAGWTLGLPAKVLSKTAEKGRTRSWSSPDGRYVLTLALEPAKDSAAMDALFEADTAESETRNVPFYNRSGDDYAANYVEGGRIHHVMVHNREGGLVRAVFAYPDEDADGLFFQTLIDQAFSVADDFALKP